MAPLRQGNNRGGSSFYFLFAKKSAGDLGMIHAPRQTQGRGNPHSQLKRAHARVQEEGGRGDGRVHSEQPSAEHEASPRILHHLLLPPLSGWNLPGL